MVLVFVFFFLVLFLYYKGGMLFDHFGRKWLIKFRMRMVSLNIGLSFDKLMNIGQSDRTAYTSISIMNNAVYLIWCRFYCCLLDWYIVLNRLVVFCKMDNTKKKKKKGIYKHLHAACPCCLLGETKLSQRFIMNLRNWYCMLYFGTEVD